MTATLVRAHYQAAIADRAALLARIEAIVDGLDGPATAARLARLDQFHFGGLAATAELARRADVRAGMRVLDAGSGLGGPSAISPRPSAAGSRASIWRPTMSRSPLS